MSRSHGNDAVEPFVSTGRRFENRGDAKDPNAVAAQLIRKHYHGVIIAASGFKRETAEAILQAGDADLVAFGRDFIANPDFVADEHFATLIGAFAASREIEAGELVTVPIDHALFQGTQARVLVKPGRPLVAAAHELLAWILQRMTMFGAARTGESSE